MKDIISKHPVLTMSADIQAICKPLQQLNISYFAHVNIDNDNHFSALGNNPGFIETYFRNKYYNNDVHMAKPGLFDLFVLWDAVDLTGRTHTMHSVASSFGVKHTFTIIEKTPSGKNYYHFANASNSNGINQVYLTNFDLLKKFIMYFNESIHQSKQLSSAYDLKFKIDHDATGYLLNSEDQMHCPDRDLFLKSISNESYPFVEINKVLAPQQTKCFQLLVQGYTSKEIAIQLGLSFRTVDHYIARVRKILNCRSSKELIAQYKNQAF